MPACYTVVEDADWFRVDWQMLDWLWEGWMQTLPEEGYEHDMAAYLTGIPVKCFGFTDADFENHHGLYVLDRPAR